MALTGNREELLSQVCEHFNLTPSIAVETGTWNGDTTQALACVFSRVYTVDLCLEYYHRAVMRFLDNPCVKCIYGDTAQITPQLCAHIQGSVFWYLDAHYSDEWPANEMQIQPTTNPSPIFQELSAILERNVPDIIVVDDLRVFGRPGGAFNVWNDITIDNLVNTVRPALTFQLPDAFAMLRNPSVP